MPDTIPCISSDDNALLVKYAMDSPRLHTLCFRLAGQSEVESNHSSIGLVIKNHVECETSDNMQPVKHVIAIIQHSTNEACHNHNTTSDNMQPEKHVIAIIQHQATCNQCSMS